MSDKNFCEVTKEQIVAAIDAEVDKRTQLALQNLALRADTITDLREFIQQQAPTAALLLMDIISGEIPAPIALRAKCASNWLDRAGYGAVTKVMRASSNGQLTPEELAAIKQRAAAALASNDAQELSDLSSKAFMTADDVYFSESGELRCETPKVDEPKEPYYEDIQLPEEAANMSHEEYFAGEHDLTYGCSRRALELALSGYPVSPYQPDVEDLRQNLDYWKWLITQGVSWYGERGRHGVFESQYWKFLTEHPELELKEYKDLPGPYVRW